MEPSPTKRRATQRRRLLQRATRGIVVLLVLTALLGAAAPAIWPRAGRPAVDRLDAALGPRDRLHFVVHLAAGRVLSLCPCARGRSETQYWKASLHADTPRERALVTNERPRGLLDLPRDALRLGRYGAWVFRNDPQWRTAAGAMIPAVALAMLALLALRHRPVRR